VTTPSGSVTTLPVRSACAAVIPAIAERASAAESAGPTKFPRPWKIVQPTQISGRHARHGEVRQTLSEGILVLTLRADLRALAALA
jgi:hypothetical protein